MTCVPADDPDVVNAALRAVDNLEEALLSALASPRLASARAVFLWLSSGQSRRGQPSPIHLRTATWRSLSLINRATTTVDHNPRLKLHSQDLRHHCEIDLSDWHGVLDRPAGSPYQLTAAF
jgi:hypothetical protein